MPLYQIREKDNLIEISVNAHLYREAINENEKYYQIKKFIAHEIYHEQRKATNDEVEFEVSEIPVFYSDTEIDKLVTETLEANLCFTEKYFPDADTRHTTLTLIKI